MTAVSQEKRGGQRIQTALPVHLTSAAGITRDVSASGVFFWTDAICARGEPISFAVEFNRPGGRMVFKCRGDVVRTEPRAARIGVAVKITELAMETA